MHPREFSYDEEQEQDYAVLVVQGSVDLETSRLIKEAITASGLQVEREKVVACWTGFTPASPDDAANTQGSPALFLLCSGVCTAQTLEALVQEGDGDSEPLEVQFGSVFALIPELEDIKALFSAEDAGDENGTAAFSVDTHADSLAEDVAGPSSPSASLKSPVSVSSSRRASITSSSSSHLQNGASFRARPAPSTTVRPSIAPRMSRAAALRMGIALPAPPAPRRASSTTGSEGSDENRPPVLVAGVDRRPVTPPKSLAKPSIAPKATKASLLRQSGGIAPPSRSSASTPSVASDEAADGGVSRPEMKKRQSANTSERSAGFEGHPGFGGRRVSVASTSNAPQIMPRQTRSSAMRTQPSSSSPAPLSKTERRHSYTTAERAALFGSSVHASQQRFASIDESREEASSPLPASKDESGDAKAKARKRTSIASLLAPTTAPRVNKASMLRATRMDDGVNGNDVLASRGNLDVRRPAMSPPLSSANPAASRTSSRFGTTTDRP